MLWFTHISAVIAGGLVMAIVARSCCAEKQRGIEVLKERIRQLMEERR